MPLIHRRLVVQCVFGFPVQFRSSLIQGMKITGPDLGPAPLLKKAAQHPFDESRAGLPFAGGAV